MDQIERAKFDAMLFALCQNEEGKASMRVFLEEIKRTGIRAKSDPRLKPVIAAIEKFKPKSNVSLESLNLDFNQFKSVLSGNPSLITKIMRNDLIIPEFENFCDTVLELYNKLKTNMDGNCASYIPQLARVPKEKWGISICTVDGQRFSIGDVHDKFTIQSTSKPITYSLTLEELGMDEVHKYQGREPSGRMFNEIVLDHNNQPHNPMVNSGAIMSASILLHLVKPEMNMAQKYDYVFAFFKKMAGGEYLGFNNSVFLSERDTADRNFALAYFLRENMCFPPGEVNITNVLDFYFQSCSLEMTAESESVIAATLANGGVCPITGEQVMKPDSVKNVLSLMLSCGLYNYSGDFAFKVGLPAKSGVSGALMLVVPNVMGICFWSPPLDEMGNTVRGVQFCEEFVRIYNFHTASGELSGGFSSLIDPKKNKYEEASQLIIHLLMAASAGDETALKSAYHQGVDMNMGDYDGRTALHLAAAEGHIRCVRFLLDICKVKHNPKDRWGQTPLQEAINFKHVKVAAILRRHERSKTVPLFLAKLGKNKDEVGEALWRKLVEKKFLKMDEKKKPVFKFDKSNITEAEKNTIRKEELRNRLNLPGRFKRVTHNSGDLSIVKETIESPAITNENSNGLKFPNPDNEDLEGKDEEEEEEDIIEQEFAAKVIQDKYRDILKRRHTIDSIKLNGTTNNPSINVEYFEEKSNGTNQENKPQEKPNPAIQSKSNGSGNPIQDNTPQEKPNPGKKSSTPNRPAEDKKPQEVPNRGKTQNKSNDGKASTKQGSSVSSTPTKSMNVEKINIVRRSTEKLNVADILSGKGMNNKVQGNNQDCDSGNVSSASVLSPTQERVFSPTFSFKSTLDPSPNATSEDWNIWQGNDGVGLNISVKDRRSDSPSSVISGGSSKTKVFISVNGKNA